MSARADLPDRLMAGELHARLLSKHIPWQVLAYPETGSTSDVLWGMAKAKTARHGTVVLAETQTAGRGRLGRVWQSRPHLGLWASLYLEPDWPMRWATRLTVLASAAAARAIHRLTQLPVRIKWPNDITWEGRKLAGILSEGAPRQNRLGFGIVGIGLNIHHAREDFEGSVQDTATSLDLATGSAWRRADVAVALLDSFDAVWALPFETVAAEWRSLCDTLGRKVRVAATNPPMEGWAEALDEDGQLILRLEDGRRTHVGSGEIFLLPEQVAHACGPGETTPLH